MSSLQGFLDKEFGEYGFDHYPGSKRKRSDPPPAAEQKETLVWDSHPHIKNYKGTPTEFFTIEALCLGLDRPAVTIRLWIRKGYIPDAPLRMKATVVNGKRTPGRRLYTRPQLEAVFAVFEQHKIRENCRVVWTKHDPSVAIEIAEAWSYLRNQK